MATIRDAIVKLADRLPLTEKEAEEVMREIMDGAATPAHTPFEGTCIAENVRRRDR